MASAAPDGLPSRSHGDRGYITVMFALLLIPLMAFAALGVDVGSWYSRGSQLQKAADAAALAGVVWMPDLSTAKSVAVATLERNGVANGGNIQVNIHQGSVTNSLQVDVTDSKVKAYFSGFFLPPISITRSATAQYVLPVPLGSPQNFFGGDASKFPGSPSQNSVSFQDPANGTKPDSYQCAMAAAGQGTAPPVKNPSSGATPAGYYDANGKAFNGNPPGGPGNSAKWAWASPMWTWNYKTNGKQVTVNYPICQWTTSVAGTPSPFPSGQSPGFWANIHGPYSDSHKGDAYTPLCYNGGDNCSTPDNFPDHRNTGYLYEVVAPPNPAGPITVSIFDAGYYPQSNETIGTADFKYGSTTANSNFGTTFQMYNADGTPLTVSDNPAMSASDCGGGAAGNTPNSGAWDLAMNDAQATFYDQWVSLCTISNPVPNGIYLIRVNVHTIGGATVGAGANRYALRAVASANPQPTISAYGDMSIYNNIAGGSADFYLARVDPIYAGKVLDVSLYDPGEASGNAYMSVMDPTTGNAASSCRWTRTNPLTGNVEASGTASPCKIQTATNGTANFNGKWLYVKINLNSSYSCTPAKAGGYSVGGCWWGIHYQFDGTANDTTTWKVSVEGNPVHLIN